jgi:hypothetical protein
MRAASEQRQPVRVEPVANALDPGETPTTHAPLRFGAARARTSASLPLACNELGHRAQQATLRRPTTAARRHAARILSA